MDGAINKITWVNTAFKSIGNAIKSPLLKTIGNTIKKPVIKTIDTTIKNTMGMFHRNQNNIKNLAFGLEKAGTNEFKYKSHWIIREANRLVKSESKKNSWMQPAEYMSRKELKLLVKKSVDLMSGKGVRSVVDTVYKSRL